MMAANNEAVTGAIEQGVKGVLLGFAAFAAFSFSDACVKGLEHGLPPYETAFFGGFFALLALPFLLNKNDKLVDVFKTTNRGLWLLRFFAYPAGVIGSVTAFTHLSMAEAFAIIFMQPAFVTVMSVLFLKEDVGLRRWLAVLTGFIGVLIILRPGFRELSIGHIGALFAGLGGAVSVITYRVSGVNEKKISLFGAGILGAVCVCGALTVANFQFPATEQWLLLAGYGLLAAFANVLLMQAAFHAPAVYIGPTQYSQMLWAILFGYLFFGDAVDLPMFVGIVLIIGAGMLTLMRERTRGTQLPPPILAGSTQAAISGETLDDDNLADIESNTP